MILKTNEKEKQGQQEKNIIGYYKRQWLSQIKCIFSVSDSVKSLREKVSSPIRQGD